jgi:PAS domain-containing protein
MNSAKSPPAHDAYEEVSELIRTLHDTEQRLEQLTGGEVDAVTDRDGRTLVLRRAQDRLRYSEAARQAAILNALPAHIALLNVHGIFISLNKTWRRSTGANPIQGSGHGIGVDYLAICDSARGQGSAEAHKVAEGIRSVLSGQAKRFSLEYSYDSPTERRRFLLTVTPLADDHPSGAVVMHLDVTTQRQTEENLRANE